MRCIIQCVPLATEPGISLIILPLMRILQQNLKTETHCRHIPFHFSHNERTPVQISLQYLHWLYIDYQPDAPIIIYS